MEADLPTRVEGEEASVCESSRDISEGTPFQMGVLQFTSLDFKGHKPYLRLLLEELWHASLKLPRGQLLRNPRLGIRVRL